MASMDESTAQLHVRAPRITRRPGRVLALVLLAILAPLGAAQQDPENQGEEEATSEDWQLASAVIKALRDGDVRSLGELTDFPRRLDEGVARGRDRRGWDHMDELDRMLASSELVQGWMDAQPRHFESGTLYNIRVLDDPDAGWGPVPDRRVTQAVVKAARSGQLLDLVLVATPDRRLLDMVFGEIYVPGLNPLGEFYLLFGSEQIVFTNRSEVLGHKVRSKPAALISELARCCLSLAWLSSRGRTRFLGRGHKCTS